MFELDLFKKSLTKIGYLLARTPESRISSAIIPSFAIDISIVNVMNDVVMISILILK